MSEVLLMGLMLVIFFACAGRFDLPFVWAYTAVVVAALLGAAVLLDRGLLKERARPGSRGEDPHLQRLVAPLFIAHMAVAGLDVGRFHWSGTIPVVWRTVALLLFALSFLLSLWAMRTNRFFSPVIRLQAERGHHIVTKGPYRLIRHPGYLAAMCAYPCGGVAVGSWVSLLPLLGVVCLLLRRTVREERYLRRQLDGYDAYAKQVRFRLVPGLW